MRHCRGSRVVHTKAVVTEVGPQASPRCAFAGRLVPVVPTVGEAKMKVSKQSALRRPWPEEARRKRRTMREVD